MGLSLFSNSDRCVGRYSPSTPISTSSPNPNPYKYKITFVEVFGDFIVAEILYDGCTTYKGKKVAVYKTSLRKLMGAESLDPHFLESGLCPIARFPANESGLQDAINFARSKSEIVD